MKLPHIMHVIDSLSKGGKERMLVDIANQTSADGYAVSVCVTRDGDELSHELSKNIRFKILGRKGKFDKRGFSEFRAFVETENPDILHVHGRSSCGFVVLMKLLRFVKQPIIFHDHYGIECNSSVPLWFRWIPKKYIDCYVGAYRALAIWAQKAGMPKNRIYTIRNAINSKRYDHVSPPNLKKIFSIRDNQIIGIGVGAICYEKGIDEFLKILKKVTTLNNVSILWAGKDRNVQFADKCRLQLKKLSLGKNFQFLGDRSDVPRLLAGADFGIMPSRSESGPLVLIEYMLAGIPFVAFKVGDISHVAHELGLPGFVAPGDQTAFLEELERLISLSKEERNLRGIQGREIAQKYFHVHTIMPKWYEVYSTLL